MKFSDLSLAIICGIAAIGLFIFSTKKLSTSLKDVGNKKTKKLLNIISKNRWIAMVTGILITTLIQSSDGAVAIIMGLLAARLINLKVAIAFLLGANIGTATTSLVVAFQSEFAFTEWFILLIVLGIFGTMFSKKENLINLFLVLFSIGLVFLSLKLMSSASKRLVEEQVFKDILAFVGINPWSAFLFSFLLCSLLQSSSATITLYQTVFTASGSALELNSAIALVFGANLGTTITGLIVSFTTKNIESKKIAVVWGFTNLVISIILLPFLWPLTYFSNFIELITDSKSLQLSLAHLFFNFILVGIFIWLINQLEIFVNKIVKDKNVEQEFIIDLPVNLIEINSSLALNAAKNAIYKQSLMSKKGVEVLDKYLITGDEKYIKKLENLFENIENARILIYEYLMKINPNTLNKYEVKNHLSLTLTSRSLDKILSYCLSIAREMKKIQNGKLENKFKLDNHNLNGIKQVVEFIKNSIDSVVKQVDNSDKKRVEFIRKMKENIETIAIKLETENINSRNNINNEKTNEKQFNLYNLFRSTERIAHHCLKIARFLDNEKIEDKQIFKNEDINLEYLDKNDNE
ncbi:Na/Pi cotransporter family protein [Mesomycoplasma lagogenitalium]|uniref:Na/Pi symporter n=1 Tax=Mesomycoplasma lagogenitalium TaxID=171286 RepID=A0ABY8LUJ9_9BACT|nr:Na/Pi symporter [Mesomycoplasma lagogenitalium]WGI36375.1 Na/Pi symporter [Mesomycoplasma lagogenitalium]